MAPLSPTRKKLRLFKAYCSGRPIWCSWQLTYVCNYRCTFCDYWKEEVNYSPAARQRESTPEDFRLAASKLGELGSLLISMAGGEPFMRPDLPEITSILAQQHIPLLTTNGSLVTDRSASELWEAGLWGASVSLDFNDETRHDSNRGVSGAAARARNALQILSRTRKRPYQRVNLLCVLDRHNLTEIEPLLRFAAANSATFMVQPYASIKHGRTGRMPLANVSSRLLALKKKYPNFVSSHAFLAGIDRFTESGVPGCRAGRSFFNVDNFLNVQKCVEFREEPLGNLRNLSPHDLVTSLRDESRRNRCTACWYNCRGEIESLYHVRGLVSALFGFAGGFVF